jgi:dihydrofolate reductase
MIVVNEFLSLDGVMEDPQNWNMSYVEETLGADVQSELDRATGLLYGRTTYDGMAAAWPKRTGATADSFNGLPKYVVSNTLTDPSWAGTTILRGDAVPSVSELRASSEGRLLV